MRESDSADQRDTRVRIFLTTALLLLLSGSLLTQASAVRELNWSDLVPEAVKFDDPYEALAREQLEYLGFVARIRNMIEAGKAVSEETRKEALELEATLEKDGIDVDGLLARRDEIRELRKKKGKPGCR